ncbi:D-3-phosphoglycerate dehydrogenase 1, chloroplastic-like protein [Tanacetum coccineum]|uniref:D-3-phosphoglycerate dehydrogenase 1, chloroplastic-like protein n=1 Tax=Tanacetum coccineum TaxID=301880 RepID=A0ABQ5IYS0_9ASTR
MKEPILQTTLDVLRNEPSMLGLCKKSKKMETLRGCLLAVRTELKPYLTLTKKLDRFAGQLVAGGRGLKSVNVTYAYAREPDDLATRLLRDMVARGIHISEEQVLLDGPLNTSHEIIQIKIFDVESRFVGAISESKDLTVEGTLKNGVPNITKVGAFEIDVNLEGNIILCRQNIRKEAVMAIVVDKKPMLKIMKKIGESRGVKEVVFLAL